MQKKKKGFPFFFLQRWIIYNSKIVAMCIYSYMLTYDYDELEKLFNTQPKG